MKKYRLDLLNDPTDAEGRDPRKCTYIHTAGERKGTFCERWSVVGDTRCPFHNGGNPLIGKPRGWHLFNHGATSKFLPIALAGKMIQRRIGRFEDEIKSDTLAEKYVAGLQDPEILDLTDEMALIDARNAQLIQRATSGETSPVLWDEVITLFDDLDSSMKMLDSLKTKRVMREMRTALKKRRDERDAWDEIFDRIETRRKLSEADRRRRESMNLLFTAEKIMDLVVKLLDAIHDAISGFAARGIISENVSKQIYLAVAHRFSRVTGATDQHILDQTVRGGNVVARSGGMDREEFLDTRIEGADTFDAVPEGSPQGSVIEG